MSAYSFVEAPPFGQVIDAEQVQGGIEHDTAVIASMIAATATPRDPGLTVDRA